MLFLLLLLCGGAFADRVDTRLSNDCVPSVDYETDFRFFPDTFQLVGSDGVEVEVAEDFRVRYDDSFKVVENLRVNESYVLYQCGTQPPDLTGLASNIKLFEIPLTSVALADVTASGFFDELGVGDRVTYASSYVTNSCLQKITHRCRREAQDPGSAFADPSAVRRQNRRVDAVFVSTASNDSKSVAFTSTMDPAVLKRAEWVKFVSLFFNKEPEANLFFNEVSESWSASQIQENAEGPLVAWISFQDFDGNEFFIHFAEYKMEYITSAGGRTLTADEIESMPGVTPTSNGYLIEFGRRGRAEETLHEILRDVDVVIDETFAFNNTAYDIDTFYETFGMTASSDFKFIENNKVFRLDATIGNSTVGTDSMDWFETAVSRPDLVLKDFQMALETQNHRNHERMWLRSLADGELPRLLTHRQCENFRSCNARPETICPSVQLTCIGDIEYRDNTLECQPLICD